MVCIAGVLGNKQVALGPLAVEAGIFAFLLLVVTSSSVAELHGRATANRLVLFGFVPLIVSLLLSLVVLAAARVAGHGPGAPVRVRDDHGRNAADLARRDPRLRHFDLSQRHHLQPAEGARGQPACCGCARRIASVLSQIVDTLIFITVAFYGVFPIGELIARPDARQGRAVGRARAAPRLCLRRPRTAARPGE